MTDTSKTAKIIKRWYHSLSHRLTVNVLLNNITFLWFLLFSMCHSLHVAVNKCLNWCFVHLYLLSPLSQVCATARLWCHNDNDVNVLLPMDSFKTFTYTNVKFCMLLFRGSPGINPQLFETKESDQGHLTPKLSTVKWHYVYNGCGSRYGFQLTILK